MLSRSTSSKSTGPSLPASPMARSRTQIVRTIIELARVFDLEVAAEGIETPEQHRLLRQMGCRTGQGFLFAKPMAANKVSELLRLPGQVLPDPEFAVASAGRVA